MRAGFLTARRDSLITVVVLFIALILFALISAGFQLNTFAITLQTGLLRAMLLFLVAAGLSLIFGLMDILNFAQGAYFMVGAYVAYDFQHPSSGFMSIGSGIPDTGLRFILGVLLATLVGAVLGIILERGLLRPLYARPLFQLVLTFGVSIIMLEAIKAIWGTTPYSWTETFGIQQAEFVVFGQQFGVYRLFVILMGFILIAAVTLLLRRTRLGITIRAGVQDAEMVSALGINIRAVFTLVFTLGCAMAAFGGAIAAPFLGVTLSNGSLYLLASIAVIVLGGLGSFEGTVIGSFLVGLGWAVMEQFSISSGAGSIWASITPMLMLALVLLLRPSGLFGEER